MEWKNDHYYLIGFSHKHQRMAHFRVDRLSGIKILPSGFTPDEGFDVAGYTNKIVDMFAADRTVSVELLCENKLMKTIIDHYGEAVPTRTYDEEHFTTNIEVDPSGTFYGWVFNLWADSDHSTPRVCGRNEADLPTGFSKTGARCYGILTPGPAFFFALVSNRCSGYNINKMFANQRNSMKEGDQ